jgi:dTDP-3-amino-3,4,6-trideoxy-alpha-D-glucose transaminase
VGEVPLFDLARQWPAIADEATAAFVRLGARGEFTLGAELAAFELEYAAYCETAECVGVGDGTAAIELALRALGVGPGSEVVTVAHTFVGTVEAITATGARPILVDVDPDTRCIDPASAAAAMTRRTRAVVCVHLYGHPAAAIELAYACDRAGVALVEDAAQAHGARVAGRRVGALGAAAAFSFYPTKGLGGMGDGGAVTTSDPEVAALVRSLRHHGSVPGDANRHVRPGATERLDNLQAALLRIKLRRLDGDIAHRRRAAARYREAMADLPIDLPPAEPDGTEAVHHLFVIGVDEREALRDALRRDGIATGVHYPTPVHLQPAWRHLAAGEGALPHTERLAARVVSLPMFSGISDEEVDRVADSVRRALL